MPNIINQLKIEHVLLDIHLFLRAFPSDTWKERPSDVPLRTVKTILHSLAKILGNKVCFTIAQRVNIASCVIIASGHQDSRPSGLTLLQSAAVCDFFFFF